MIISAIFKHRYHVYDWGLTLVKQVYEAFSYAKIEIHRQASVENPQNKEEWIITFCDSYACLFSPKEEDRLQKLVDDFMRTYRQKGC